MAKGPMRDRDYPLCCGGFAINHARPATSNGLFAPLLPLRPSHPCNKKDQDRIFLSSEIIHTQLIEYDSVFNTAKGHEICNLSYRSVFMLHCCYPWWYPISPLQSH